MSGNETPLAPARQRVAERKHRLHRLCAIRLNLVLFAGRIGRPPARFPTYRVAGLGIPIAPDRRRTGNAVSSAETRTGGDAICDAVKRPRGLAWFRAKLHPHAVRGFPRLVTDASEGRGRRRRTGDNQDETRSAPRVRRRLHAPVVPHPAGRIPILRPLAQLRQLRSQQGSEIMRP